MGEARNRGNYKQRKNLAIKKKQEEYIAEGVKKRDRIMAMTPEEKANMRKVKLAVMAMSQWKFSL
jgi:hypothetical protein